MKIQIDDQLIDTEMIYSISNIIDGVPPQYSYRCRTAKYFQINFIGNANTVTIARPYSFWRKSFKFEELCIIDRIDPQTGIWLKTPKVSVKYDYESIVFKLRDDGYSKDQIVEHFLTLEFDNNGNYMFDDLAEKKVTEIRDELLTYWEPDQTKFIKIT